MFRRSAPDLRKVELVGGPADGRRVSVEAAATELRILGRTPQGWKGLTYAERQGDRTRLDYRRTE